MIRTNKLNSILGSFEKVINENRKAGCDKDLLGRQCVPPSKLCTGEARGRRHSMSYSGVPRQPEPQRKPRRMSLVGIDNPTSLCSMQSSSAPSSPTVQEKKVSPQATPSVSIIKAPEKIQTEKEFASSPSSSQSPETSEQIQATEPMALSVEKEQKTNNEESFADKEAKALEQRIAELQFKLRQTQRGGRNEVKEIERDTKEGKEQFRESQRSKYGVTERNTAIRMLNAMIQKRQLKENQKAIVELQKANKALRQERENLHSGILSFREENAKLASEIASIQEHFESLANFRGSEEKTYSRLNEGLPLYRHRVEELRTEGERRDSLTQLERNVKNKCDKCTESIFKMIRIQCDDNEMLDSIGGSCSHQTGRAA